MKKIDKNIDIVVGVSIGVIVLMASGILCIISMLVSDCIIMQFFYFLSDYFYSELLSTGSENNSQ